jgi:hypothetical protein
VLRLQGYSDGIVASRSQTEGGFSVVNVSDTRVFVYGKSSLEIEVSGSAAAQAAIDIDFDAAIALGGVARTVSMISANAQSHATVQPGARMATGNSAIAQANLEITGMISGTSQAPLFAQAASGVLIGGFAKLDAAVSGAGQVGSAADLVGASDGKGAISGAGVLAVEIALNLSGATEVPVRAASVAQFGGDASTIVGQTVAAADVFAVMGASAVGLPVNGAVQGEFDIQGDAVGFSGVTVSAQDEITVTRTLVTDVAIFADAARVVGLNGQGAASVASGVTSAIASIVVSGATTAATLALIDARAMLGFSGQTKANADTASDVSGTFEIRLSASVAVPRRAMSSAVFRVIASTAAETNMASEASGDFATVGTANSAGQVKAMASTAMAFGRDMAAEAAIDATSTRAIAFGLDALAQVASAASSAGLASNHLATSAAVASRAHAAGGLGLEGVVSANGGVNASGASAINAVGTSVALAVVGSQSQGVFAIASAGEADVEIDAESSRSILLAGEAASSVRLLAEAVVGKLDLGLTVAAVNDGRADASGAINLAGLGRGESNARAQASGVVSVTCSGAGDVSIIGQSDRLVTFLGHASIATTTKAAANTTLPVIATASSGVSEALCMRLSPCRFDRSFIEPFWV